jgi:hypothetical protein
MSDQPLSDFEKATSGQSSTSLLREFWDFLRYNKKWWLFPVVLVLLLFGVLLLVSGTAAAPFIYTLF